MRVLRACHRTATVVIAASGIPKNRAPRMRRGGITAMMCTGSPAAGMRGRSFRLQRERDQCPDKRDQQQESGRKPLHAFG